MKISDVSKMFNLSIDTLRYYEKEGLMDPVEKNESGHRDYIEKDIRRVRFIKSLRSAGVSISAIKKYVDLFNEGEHTIPERKNILIKQRAKLADKIAVMQEVLAELDYSIENYEETYMKRELIRRHPEQYKNEEYPEYKERKK